MDNINIQCKNKQKIIKNTSQYKAYFKDLNKTIIRNIRIIN